eukprot:4598136-Alexandrium_andersonii.AAC.1
MRARARTRARAKKRTWALRTRRARPPWEGLAHCRPWRARTAPGLSGRAPPAAGCGARVQALPGASQWGT